MLSSTRYKLTIHATPKDVNMMGKPQTGFDYWYEFMWDDRIWATGAAGDPSALGRSLGLAIQTMAEQGERGLTR